MDLKNKRIIGIAQIIMFAATLALYTRIGGMGMIYAAGSFELFFIITYLFVGGIPDALEYMLVFREKREQRKLPGNIFKASVAYGILSVIMAEAALYAADYYIIGKTDLLYIDRLLELFMLTIPFIAVFQILSGIMQAYFDRIVVGIARLVFAVCMVITTGVFIMISGDYGSKAASLMQSMKMEYFYVVLGLIPGVLAGSVGGIIFLAVVWMTHSDQVRLFKRKDEVIRENVGKLVWNLFIAQITEAIVPCFKRIPIIVLLWLSLGEISAENYLFGNFYGAILPMFGIIWTIFDLGLIPYQKRLYIAYRRKEHEQFYRDLKTVLCYTLIYSMVIGTFTFALHKSYLAIWNLQTFISFMELTRTCSILGLLGLPNMVLGDILKCRGMHRQYTIFVMIGTVVSVAGSIAYASFLGAGTWLCIINIGAQSAVTIVLCAWALSNVVGIHYMSVVIRTAGSIIFTFVIAVLLYAVQQFTFTALGGLGTMIVCILIGLLLQFLAIYFLRVFDKQEMQNLPFSFVTKYITKIF